MNGLDAALGLVLAFGIWRGGRTGALVQIVNSVGWVAGFVVATALMGPVGRLIAFSLGVSHRTAPVLGFVVTFGAVLLGITIVATIFRRTLEAIKLGVLDKAAGGAFGAFRAAFGLSVFLLATSFSPLQGGDPLMVDAETRDGSVLYEPVETLAPDVWGAIRAATPGLQRALVDKFNTWQEGRPESVTGEAPLE
ncbi:CvpA family protein [Rubrivirga sp. IMCC43871]|uniref:CvpA family protein n=1 Tax=Rubrivirga sp. IMCC43871 TaxID=3391575 RepID=UPI00398FC53D